VYSTAKRIAAGRATDFPAKCTVSTRQSRVPQAREMKVTPAVATAIVCGNPMMHAWLLETLRAA